MEVNTKLGIGDEVFFFDRKRMKVSEGTITGLWVGVSVGETEVSYLITPKDKEKLLCMPENVPEALVFKGREAVFEFCYKLTEGI